MAVLDREMLRAAAEMPLAAFRHLVALGADARFAARLRGAGDIGTARVSIDRGGWSPAGPTPRLLLAVRDAAGDLIDIAALSSTCRDEWALRTGAGWALGEGNADDAARAALAEHRHVTLRLHATPFNWLAAGGDGICVLDWNAGALAQLRSLGERVTLVTADPAGAERLKAMLAHGGLPRVRSGTERRMAA